MIKNEREISTEEGLAEKEARTELSAFGLLETPENIRAVIEQRNTKQHPDGFEDIFQNINDDEYLKKRMAERGISSIMHAEGDTVWNHVKLAMIHASEEEQNAEERRDLALIMLYHDLGKTAVRDTEENKTVSQERLLKHGDLVQTMRGHDEARKEDIEKGILSNEIPREKAVLFSKLIENHMKQDAFKDCAPKKLAKIIQTFGEDDSERKSSLLLLLKIFKTDSGATRVVELVDGEIQRHPKVPYTDMGAIWEKYEEGKRQLASQQA